MLRQRVRGKESDRYITARSVERDKMIDKYKITDDINYTSINDNPTKSADKKIRTPTIICDENQYSKKLYLSLLKSQILDQEKSYRKSNENICGREVRRKKKAYHQQNSKNEDNGGNLIENSQSNKSTAEVFNDLSSDNRLNLYEYPSNYLTTQSYLGASSNEKIDMNSFDFASENSKPASFMKLINFEIEEREYTKKFLRQKKIPKAPYKVLDAPNLKDDFYLHLLDWSCQDLLAVGLERALYIWEGKSSNVNLLSTLEEEHLTSVCWMNDGNHLLVGTNAGKINLWDVETSKCVTSYYHHVERVGIIRVMNTNKNIFTSGSQDRMIINYDVRIPSTNITSKLTGHTQEVCGLNWSLDDRRLASGGNDNKLILWSCCKNEPEKKFNSHTSAVKALDWSPHKFGYLLSGGGTQDRTLKLWNTSTMKLVESIDTSSQVCNVAYSSKSHEFVTTHGYSDNFILVWDSDTMDVKATLKGHKDRVIYFSKGPDGQKIVTGAGDETIRFWDVFIQTPLKESDKYSNLEIKSANIR